MSFVSVYYEILKKKRGENNELKNSKRQTKIKKRQCIVSYLLHMIWYLGRQYIKPSNFCLTIV